MAKKAKEVAEEPLEKKLWKTADKLRKNMDATEYKHETNLDQIRLSAG